MIHGSHVELGLWSLAALVLGAFLAGRMDPDLDGFTARLRGRRVVLLLVMVGSGSSWLLWGSLASTPLVHDEASYLLQAQIFAGGDWAVAAPPLAHFFEQFHVLVSPVLAPKYPPGHAILLVPGVLLGLPGLVPVILNGLTGGLVFSLVRRVCNPWAALMAWFLWLIAPAGMAFRPSYFSEVTTGFLMLLAWWQLLDWRDSGKPLNLMLVSLAVSWSAITRPLTALAFALPIIVCVVWIARSRGAWKQVALGALVGLLVVSLIPWHNLRTTGDWMLTPYRHYSEVYFPFDVPGFATQTAAGLRELPGDMQRFRELYLPYHLAHTWGALPATLIERVLEICHTTWGSWWPLLGPLSLVALVRPSRELIMALVTAALLIIAYAVFAHPPEWVLYYMEAQEILCMLTGLGVWQGCRFLTVLFRSRRPIPSAELMSRTAVALCVLLLVMTPFEVQHFEKLRKRHRSRAALQVAFREQVSALSQKAVVFVRYAQGHDIHSSLIVNVPDLEAAPAWVVYDRGAENAQLLAVAGGREAYIFDEESGRLLRMDPETGRISAQ
jgi:hypothetical protein